MTNRIQQHIKRALKGNSDLIDSTSLIDSSLTYSENKAEIQPLISLLSDTETTQDQQTNTTKKAIVEVNNHYEKEAFKVTLKGFWHSLHKKHKHKLMR